MPIALVTGITGQDGSYLAEFLGLKGYEVHGLKRRSSSLNTDRVDHLYEDVHSARGKFFLHYSDLTDASSLASHLSDIRPDEVYNLAAQSHVKVSFEIPEYTADVGAIGAVRLLEAIRRTVFIAGSIKRPPARCSEARLLRKANTPRSTLAVLTHARRFLPIKLR